MIFDNRLNSFVYVFVRVTIGIGELIHISNADAREVSWGFISLMAVIF